MRRVKAGCLRPLDYTPSVFMLSWWRRASGSNARGDGVTGLGLASQPLATRAALRSDRRMQVSADSDAGSHRQKQPLLRQQRLKRLRRAARAEVIAAELLGQILHAAHHAVTALDCGFRREALAALARDLESSRRLRRSSSWHTSCAVVGTGRPGWARSTGLRLMRALLCR